MVPGTEPSVSAICRCCCCSYCRSEPAAGAGWRLGGGATRRHVAGRMVPSRNTRPDPQTPPLHMWSRMRASRLVLGGPKSGDKCPRKKQEEKTQRGPVTTGAETAVMRPRAWATRSYDSLSASKVRDGKAQSLLSLCLCLLHVPFTLAERASPWSANGWGFPRGTILCGTSWAPLTPFCPCAPEMASDPTRLLPPQVPVACGGSPGCPRLL